MHTFPNDEIRLQLLNEAQPGRPWGSCKEKRRCIMCERTFRGSDVIVRQSREGVVQLGCPNCDSKPQFWVRLGNPLLEEHIWADWEVALRSSGDDTTGEDAFQSAS
jgi:hypothetical protein